MQDSQVIRDEGKRERIGRKKGKGRRTRNYMVGALREGVKKVDEYGKESSNKKEDEDWKYNEERNINKELEKR